MALYKYFCSNSRQTVPPPSAVEEVNQQASDGSEDSNKVPRGPYNGYTAKQRADIGKYAMENGPTRAAKHFSCPESTARRLKAEYLKKLAQVKAQNKGKPSAIIRAMKELPTKPQGRPVLLGDTLDKLVQEYVTSQRKAGAPVNTTILAGAIKGIVAAHSRSLLIQYGGHLDIKKSLCISLLNRMGYTKRKCTNAGKVSLHNLAEIQGDFLADIQAEVLMNNVPLELIFNWDQTAYQLVSGL